MSYVFYYGNKDLINIDNPTTISAAFVYIDLARGWKLWALIGSSLPNCLPVSHLGYRTGLRGKDAQR